jgi:hypothetical protein
LTVLGVSVAGANPLDFSIGLETCTAAPVAPNATCSIPVSFAPTDIGARSATLSITSDAPGSPHSADLSGTGN